ncbi:MAG: formate dehydrogenase accessory protein FdhE [Acetobacteraceae bacterium]|nr:formate dehydrogenase accessory protein FdhE [Acetobacteraceae bacterium]
MRFARSAARLEAVLSGHPMQDWLQFLARLMRAQHTVAVSLPASPDPDRISQGLGTRMPPLAADGYRRDPAWREALAGLLDAFGDTAMPQPARQAMEDLRGRDAQAKEDLAEAFLRGLLNIADAGAALYVAAALQVHFTSLAACLPQSLVPLLPERGLCPCCGSTPVAGVVTATGPAPPGTRYLHCSLCATAWNHVRAICITCGRSQTLALRGIEGDTGAVKAETCDDCRTYAKMLYQARDTQVDPFADDLATLGLDLLVSQAGWSRHAPNPWLLVGHPDPVVD